MDMQNKRTRTRDEILAQMKKSIMNKQRAIAESQLRINAEALKTAQV